MNVVIYTQISTDTPHHEHLNICHPLAQSRGWQVYGNYADENTTAKSTDRPEFQRLLSDAQAGQFQIVIVPNVDHLGRSVIDLLAIFNDFNQAGVSFVSATESFDFTTFTGQMMLNLLAIFNQRSHHKLNVGTAGQSI